MTSSRTPYSIFAYTAPSRDGCPRENTADDPGRRKPDITKIKTAFGWEPKVALRDGLKLMMEDFKVRLRVE